MRWHEIACATPKAVRQCDLAPHFAEGSSQWGALRSYMCTPMQRVLVRQPIVNAVQCCITPKANGQLTAKSSVANSLQTEGQIGLTVRAEDVFPFMTARGSAKTTGSAYLVAAC